MWLIIYFSVSLSHRRSTQFLSKLYPLSFEFYKQLRFTVQSLSTLGRLEDVKGNVRSTLDKLKGIKADLVRGKEGWKDWDFKDLVAELKKWIDIYPVEESIAEKSSAKGNPHHKEAARVFKTQANRSQKEPRAA